MNPSVTFDKIQIAPCGINCGTCYASLRPGSKCRGCLVPDPDKPKTRLLCRIKFCEKHDQAKTIYCCDCDTFPCQRMRHIDQRYRTRFKTSLIQNLEIIREVGMEKYLANEIVRWTCPDCGSLLSVHLGKCLNCGFERKTEIH